jgi:hypothetical protein
MARSWRFGLTIYCRLLRCKIALRLRSKLQQAGKIQFSKNFLESARNISAAQKRRLGGRWLGNAQKTADRRGLGFCRRHNVATCAR